jgi:hypothetical protein
MSGGRNCNWDKLAALSEIKPSNVRDALLVSIANLYYSF